MLAITRILLSPQEVLTTKLTDAYALHKLVYEMFPKQPDGRDFLYSYDFYGSGFCKIEILSRRLPIVPLVGRLESKQVPERFWKHRRYRFEIWVNPVMRSAKDRKLIPLKKEENAIKWLIKSLDRVGLETNPSLVEIIGKRDLRFKKGQNLYTFWGIKFRGILGVNNGVDLEEVVMRGIGKGKAFGFGLLKLVPVVMK